MAQFQAKVVPGCRKNNIIGRSDVTNSLYLLYCQ